RQIQDFVDLGLRAVGASRTTTFVKTTGDGAILAFDEAAHAHEFAQAVYQATQDHNADRTEASARRSFRMGAATGEVTLVPLDGGGRDIAGTTIANAVRLEAASHPGELLIDLPTYDRLPPPWQRLYGPPEEVRGKREERFLARRAVLIPAAEQTRRPRQHGQGPPPPAMPGPTPEEPAPPPRAALKLVLSYKRNAHPDGDLVRLLEGELAARGHEVFVDRQLRVGFEWAREIEARVRAADALIPLLSAASVPSEMLAWEVQTAHDEAQKRGGKPRLLPVRVAFESPLPAELAGLLDRFQHVLWTGPPDTRRLVDELIDALRRPPPIHTPRSMPVGGLPLDADSYVTRAADAAFHAALDRRDSIVLLRGARQVGKTSLLARGLQRARDAGAAVAFTDFQKLNRSELESPETLYRALGAMIAAELDLDVFPDDAWDARRAPNTNFDRFLRREVLEKLDKPLVWAIDEADRLFSCPFGSEVFGLFRSWHNARAMNPSGPWRRLTLAIAYATEAQLFITDINQSPFNVGTLVPLEDFTPEQVADLNRRYGSPLRSDADRTFFHRLVGGHPYLVNRGLYELAGQAVDVSAFATQAERDEGLFGDHLRRILVLLARDPDLCDVVRGVLRGKTTPDPKSFYRLRAAGVLAGDSAGDARPRCLLYETYLKKHLP
ncbi:MAG TPA: AAA-like domain-containing protein, partial [Isosphaeraceae bacterium]